jgi:hypothetical protein
MTEPGLETALRDIWFGQVWRANAARVVADGEDVVALWMPAGAPSHYPVDQGGVELRIPRRKAILGERRLKRDALALLRPGARHSIWLFWEGGAFSYWYVNLEQTLGWNDGFFDIIDEKLDLIVTADGILRWKDEDELERAAELGLLDAPAVRAEAERVIEKWPFPTGWEDFRPQQDWPLPRLPSGWNERTHFG